MIGVFGGGWHAGYDPDAGGHRIYFHGMPIGSTLLNIGEAMIVGKWLSGAMGDLAVAPPSIVADLQTPEHGAVEGAEIEPTSAAETFAGGKAIGAMAMATLRNILFAMSLTADGSEIVSCCGDARKAALAEARAELDAIVVRFRL